ncbi:MAG: lamin tail domain-containing protein [Xanthomonadaceae bacterium]|nr:lamin tail domain-containing protein [Xanthomonadaceae bacterium]
MGIVSVFARGAMLLLLAAVLPAQAQVVVSQVYGGGGNSGAPIRSDFIELFNSGDAPVSVDGWSVQYASATGTSWARTDLAGSIAPGGYYLVKQADGANTAAPALPTPDATGTIAMASTNGKVALVSSTTSLTGACPLGADATIVDFVGFGATASCFEGSGPTPTLSNTLAALRAADGCTDSDDNSADFATGSPAPRNSASPSTDCGGGGGNDPTAPSASGSANPASAEVGTNVLFTVDVTPGSNPESTGLTVTGDFTAIGGGNAVAFSAAPGSTSFTASVSIGAGTTVGDKILPISIADAESRTGNTQILLTVASSGGGGDPTGVVISQVYGGGGNSGATLRNDFIELFNPGSTAISLDGASVQYTSATGTTWQVTALSGSIPAQGYFLVQQAAGTGGSEDLPTPDATGTIAMSGTNGKVALVGSTTALSGACPLGGAATIADFVGYGSANCFEGSGATSALSNTTAALRLGDGCTDTNVNSADFITAPPTPRNSASASKDCDAPPPPVVVVPISSVQGTGNISPVLGEVVTVEGVVTARKSNGYFVQTPDAEVDADPSTSEGLFVFTTSAGVPAAAQIGNRVQVTGTVAEFTPASAPNQLSLGQLTFATTTLIDTGNPLPAPVLLGVAELDPANPVDFLERYEGMRVAVAELTVAGPSLANINETQATATGSGVFYGVPAGIPRPLRETGVGVLDVTPFPNGVTPPIYDTNPELLRIDSRGAGGTAIDVDVGATVSGLVGVLDYGFAAYSILPDPTSSPTVSGGTPPRPARAANDDEITIASFNVQRLFDDDSGNNIGGSPTLTTAAYQARLVKTANALCAFLGTPDILGIVEIEGIDALTDLANAVNSNLPGTCANDPNYVAFLEEGNDVGGIDVGFLVATAPVATGLPRVTVVEVVQEGKDALQINPNGSTSLLNDRPPLRLNALVNGDNGDALPLTVIANHLRSLNGINDVGSGSNGWPTTGDRIRDKRIKQAQFLAELVQARQAADPDEAIVLLGDFNAFEFSDGYADVMGIATGLPAPADSVVAHGDSPLDPALLNLTLIKPTAERYSFVFDGSAQTLDHIVVNGAAMAAVGSIDVDHARINADFRGSDFGNFAVPTRVSDHDPVIAYLSVPGFLDADLALSIESSPLPVLSGNDAVFNVVIANAGPSSAASPTVTIAVSAAAEAISLAPEAGWNCLVSPVGASSSQVACSAAELVDQDSARIGLRVRTTRVAAIQFLTVSATAATASNDPVSANDGDQAAVRVVGKPQ